MRIGCIPSAATFICSDEPPALQWPLPPDWEQQQRTQQQRSSAAAQRLAHQSEYLYPDLRDRDSDDSNSDFEEDSDDEFFGAAMMNSRLRGALACFNQKCYEEGASFQWFEETITGPLQIQEVRGNHWQGCGVCDTKPGFGELFFK
jgi:hypothetical protein